MSINTEQRQQLVKHLAQTLAKASGYDVNQAGVSQWEIAADALVKAIEGIVQSELMAINWPKPTTADEREP